MIGYLQSRPLLPVAILLMAGIAAGRFADNLFYAAAQGIALSPTLMLGALLMLLLVVALLLRRMGTASTIVLACATFVMGMFLFVNSDAGQESTEPDLVVKVRQVMERQRDRLSAIYVAEGLQGDDYSIVAAMTLGERDRVGKELRDTYYATGAGHIFALSGMHLAILMFLITLFLPLAYYPRFSVVVQLLALWSYVLLVVFHPSILRAAVMLSTYALHRAFSRRPDGINSLFFTAVLLLVIRPSWLFDVGFQMSFMAVLGIMTLCRSRHWLLGILLLSIAAQLAVTPLVLHYFGRISPWFLLTNLVLSPAVFLIISLSIALLLASLAAASMPFLHPLAHGVSVVLSWTVHNLNAFLRWVSTLPYANINGLHISVAQTVLLYVIIVCLIALLYRLSPAFRRYLTA